MDVTLSVPPHLGCENSESPACVTKMRLWMFEGDSRGDGIKSRGGDSSRGAKPSGSLAVKGALGQP